MKIGLMIGCHPLKIGCRLLMTGCRLLKIGLMIGCRPLKIDSHRLHKAWHGSAESLKDGRILDGYKVLDRYRSCDRCRYFRVAKIMENELSKTVQDRYPHCPVACYSRQQSITL